MKRRDLLTACAVLASSLSSPTFAQASEFQRLLDEYTSDPQLAERAWLYREPTVARGVGSGRPSTRKISERAIRMIIDFEVSGEAQYQRRYQRPIWPKGESGVTIGIGYDLRFARRNVLRRDWTGLIDEASLTALEPVLRLGGPEARDALPLVQSVVVPWKAADVQFRKFLFYPTADAEVIFPNSDELSDDSFGALVSLVYNRGNSIPRNKPSRAEMVAIHDLMIARKYSEIPSQIRKMKRLWTTNDNRGVALRRDIEAALFEEGMR